MKRLTICAETLSPDEIEFVRRQLCGFDVRVAPPPADDQARRDAEAKYQELIYAVATVFPGESSHETALRYIRNAESGHGCTAQAASAAEGAA